MRAKTLQALATAFEAQKKEFLRSERDRWKERYGDGEIQAYETSDPIAPQYFYQRGNRTRDDFLREAKLN